MIKAAVRILWVIIGAGVISGISGCAGDGAKYSKYSNSNPQVNLAVEYPEGWKYITYKNKQSGFPIVMFAPPSDTTKGAIAFSVFMSVEVADMKDAAGKELSEKAVTDGIVEREMKMPQAQLVSRAKTSIGLAKAEDIKISLKMLEKLDVKKANLLPSQAHIVAIKKGNKVYAVKLVAKQEEYERYGKAFDHMVKTLKVVN